MSSTERAETQAPQRISEETPKGVPLPERLRSNLVGILQDFEKMGPALAATGVPGAEDAPLLFGWLRRAAERELEREEKLAAATAPEEPIATSADALAVYALFADGYAAILEAYIQARQLDRLPLRFELGELLRPVVASCGATSRKIMAAVDRWRAYDELHLEPVLCGDAPEGMPGCIRFAGHAEPHQLDGER